MIGPGGPRPAVRPRPMGGFSQGMGGLNEHMDESAMQAASQQKALGQQQAATPTQSGAANASNPLQNLIGGQPDAAGAVQPRQPREIGTLTQELVKRPVQDVIRELTTNFFNVNTLLGIKSADSPEDQAKKKQLHQRWQKLDKERQQVAQKRFQQEMQKKKQAEEETEAKKRQEEQRKAQSIQMPSSPKKGPVGPSGSKKQRAVTQLEQDRKGIGKVAGKN